MRSLRIRKQVVLPVPRPYRMTCCTVAGRAELARVLHVIDSALSIRRDTDASTAMSVVFDTLISVEPELNDHRNELEFATSLGVALNRVQQGEAGASTAASLKADSNHVDLLLWNAIAWAGIEAAARLPAELGSFADYCVRTGHYVAHHGLSAVRDVEKELHDWAVENTMAATGRCFEAFADDQLIGIFWLDRAGSVTGRSALPVRPGRSVEKLYDDLIFDIAWDDLHAALGHGRPRKTTTLSHLVSIDWEPSLDEVACAAPAIDLRQHEFVDFVPAGSPLHEPAPALAAATNGVAIGRANGAPNNAANGAPNNATNGARYAPIASDQPPVRYITDGAANGRSTAVVAGAGEPLAPLTPAVPDRAARADPVPMNIQLNGHPPGSHPPIGAPAPVALPPAGWFPDPLRRFDHRWWDGVRWTSAVHRDGAVGRDEARP